MKTVIRLTENDLHNIIKEAVRSIIMEDGALGGSNLANDGSSDPSMGVAYPAFGGKTNKKKVGGNAFSEPIMRQKHNLGDVTQAKVNQVDMKPTADRTLGKVHNG